MHADRITPFSSAAFSSSARQASAAAVAGPAREDSVGDDRRRVGELVGNIFYGTLLREAQASRLKRPLMHGGRGEETFNGQLALELAKRIGESQQNPLADRIYRAILKRHGGTATLAKIRTK